VQIDLHNSFTELHNDGIQRRRTAEIQEYKRKKANDPWIARFLLNAPSARSFTPMTR
jgi:hypothetical protein